ncbi:MAG: type II toxin-antitoxin system VapC family toxin [Egibacteraceae bacterium]
MTLPRRLGLDTNCFVYLLNDPRSRRAEWLAAEIFMPMAAGHVSAVTSVITVAELLVRPYRLADLVGARRLRDALETMPGLELRPVHTTLADQAAELRGRTGIPLPDALQAATMAEAGVDAALTNDQRWRKLPLPLPVLFLDDLVSS